MICIQWIISNGCAIRVHLLANPRHKRIFFMATTFSGFIGKGTCIKSRPKNGPTELFHDCHFYPGTAKHLTHVTSMLLLLSILGRQIGNGKWEISLILTNSCTESTNAGSDNARKVYTATVDEEWKKRHTSRNHSATHPTIRPVEFGKDGLW